MNEAVDFEMDQMLRAAAAGAPCHEPRAGLARHAAARAHAARKMQKLQRVRRIQHSSALAAAIMIGLVLWIGSSRLHAVSQTDVTTALTSSTAATSASNDQSLYASVLLGLLIAAGAFAGWRSFERPPADLSPLWRFG